MANLTKAAGTRGMIGGQVVDITSEGAVISRVELEKMHAMKTAAMIGFSAAAPAIVLQLESDVEQSLSQFGEAIGLAFQIIDDVLDIEGKTEILGKTAGKDQEKKKATYPSLLGLEESKRLATDLIASACEFISPFDRFGYLTALAKYILERNK